MQGMHTIRFITITHRSQLTRFLREMLGLILIENSFQFNGENHLQTYGTAMGTKMAVSFANERNQAKKMETIY